MIHTGLEGAITSPYGSCVNVIVAAGRMMGLISGGGTNMLIPYSLLLSHQLSIHSQGTSRQLGDVDHADQGGHTSHGGQLSLPDISMSPRVCETCTPFQANSSTCSLGDSQHGKSVLGTSSQQLKGVD